MVPRTSTGTAELLGFASSAIGDQQGAVVLEKGLLQGVLGELIDVFLVVGDDGLGDRLADGVDLRGVATTGDAHADIDFGEALEAEEEDGLVDLELCVSLGGFVRTLALHGWMLWEGCFCSLGLRRTLNLRISGWTRLRGLPLTLTRPLPFCGICEYAGRIVSGR